MPDPADVIGHIKVETSLEVTKAQSETTREEQS